jgi:hypothetical protein
MAVQEAGGLSRHEAPGQRRREFLGAHWHRDAEAIQNLPDRCRLPVLRVGTGRFDHRNYIHRICFQQPALVNSFSAGEAREVWSQRIPYGADVPKPWTD